MTPYVELVSYSGDDDHVEEDSQDRAITELAEMDFTPAESKTAIERTNSGKDVGAAVDWFISQAACPQRRKNPTMNQSSVLPIMSSARNKDVTTAMLNSFHRAYTELDSFPDLNLNDEDDEDFAIHRPRHKRVPTASQIIFLTGGPSDIAGKATLWSISTLLPQLQPEKAASGVLLALFPPNT